MNSNEEQPEISEAQKNLVLDRIIKYEQNPELLISEEDALKLIAEM